MTLSTKYYGFIVVVTADINVIDATIAILFKDDMRAKINKICTSGCARTDARQLY